MGLGSAGGSGGSSSSSSNLSPLAPPFTVDRFNRKPNSSPIMNFTDMAYAVAPALAAPLGHTRQYIQHSETRPDVFPKPKLGGDDSTRTTHMPLSNEWHNSVPESVNGSSTQWSALGPGCDTPLASDNRYLVSGSIDPSCNRSAPPFGHNWQYHSQQASETLPNVSLKSKFDVYNSTTIMSTPLANDYNYSVSHSVNPSGTQWSGVDPGVKSSSNGFYAAEEKPYFPAYVSSVVSKDSPLVSLSESGYSPFSASGHGSVSYHADFTQRLPSLEPKWGGLWSGLGEPKQGNQVESSGYLSSETMNNGVPLVYKNYINQGLGIESGDVSVRDSCRLYGISTDGIQRESQAGSFSVKSSDDKSLFAQELGHFSLKNSDEKSWFAQELGSGISYGKVADRIEKEGFTGSFGTGNVTDETLNAQKLGFLPFEPSGAQFLGSSSLFPVSQPSDPFQESLNNFFNQKKKYGQCETAIKPPNPVMQDSAPLIKPSCAVVIRAPVGAIRSPAKDPVTNKTLVSGNVTNISRKNLDCANSSKAKEPGILPSPESMEGSFNTSKLESGGELSSEAQHGDSLDATFKIGSTHVTDRNVSPSLYLSLDHVQAFKYPENPSDPLDNYNPAVDSPCWKGAPVSCYSSLDVVEASTTHHLLEKPESHDLDATGNHTAPRMNDSRRASSQVPTEGDTHNKHECIGNGTASPPSSTRGSTCPAKESYSADDAINFNYSSEGGVIAYHAAKNVLCPPSDLENFVECHQPSGRETPAKMDVPMLINAMRNLAELLCFYCSSDSCGLKEHDEEVLKHVISNLNSCMSKKIDISSPAQEPMSPQQGISGESGDVHDSHLGKCADLPQQRYQGSVRSSGQCADGYVHTEKINISESGKKDDRTPYNLPVVDDLHISSNENIVQAIKKVLNENFIFEEEMQSQSQLFKNLWLEAEAKLCSISYRARFDHMRMQMDNYKPKQERDVGKVSVSTDSLDLKATSGPASQSQGGPIQEGTVTNHSTFSTNPCQKALSLITDDIDASVLARFNLSRSRDEKSNREEQQQTYVVDTGKAECQFKSTMGGFDPEGTFTNHSSPRNSHADDVEASVFARFNILKHRDEIFSAIEQQQPNMINTMQAGQLSSSVGVFSPEGTINNHSTSGNSHVDDVEASVFARFNMLCCRDDKSIPDQRQLDMIDSKPAGHADNDESSVLTKFDILKSRDFKSNTEGQQFSNTLDTMQAESQYGSYTCGSGYESMKDFCSGVTNVPVMHPDRNGRSGYQRLPGWYDKSSWDWEHVMKEDFAWPK